MPQEDAGLQLLIAADRYAREKRELEHAKPVRHGGKTPSPRQRAGLAVISLGERLAGERRPATAHAVGSRRLATRAS